MPVVIVLDNLRSAFNVGNIFRLAESLRVRQIIGCGYTALPPHAKLAKTARGCDRLVSSRRLETSRAAAQEMKNGGYRLVAVETAVEATAFHGWQAEFPLALVFGNEALGIAPAILAECDDIVRLPAYGQKNSINVANCAAAVLYEVRRQWETTHDLT